MKKIRLSAIAAMAENRIIGKDNDLPWRIPEDLKYFMNTTMGKPLIMGRKCFESINCKPLPGRPHIIISRSHSAAEKEKNELLPSPFLLYYVKSIEEGIAKGRDAAAQIGADEIFIAGGGEIYRQTMDQIDRLYLTVVHRDFEGDVFFPDFDWNDWRVISEDRHDEEGNTPPFTFFVLERT